MKGVCTLNLYNYDVTIGTGVIIDRIHYYISNNYPYHERHGSLCSITKHSRWELK